MTIELNEAGNMIDIHRFTVEMSFDKQPRTKPGYRDYGAWCGRRRFNPA